MKNIPFVVFDWGFISLIILQFYKEQAKYYADRAEAIVDIGIATTSKAGIVKPDGDTIFVDEGGKITAGISDSDWDVLDNLFAWLGG